MNSWFDVILVKLTKIARWITFHLLEAQYHIGGGGHWESTSQISQ